MWYTVVSTGSMSLTRVCSTSKWRQSCLTSPSFNVGGFAPTFCEIYKIWSTSYRQHLHFTLLIWHRGVNALIRKFEAIRHVVWPYELLHQGSATVTVLRKPRFLHWCKTLILILPFVNNFDTCGGSDALLIWFFIFLPVEQLCTIRDFTKGWVPELCFIAHKKWSKQKKSTIDFFDFWGGHWQAWGTYNC